MFIGREAEMGQLKRLKDKKAASLVCVVGRRRIGKSTLIEEFSKGVKNFISIQGLGPDQNASNQDQLDHFSRKMAAKFKTGQEKFDDWETALMSLAEKTKHGEWLILLDEISWMGEKDKLFPVKIKDAWDTMFKKNSKLIMVLCGSVSSWIEENILENSTFVGRVTLTINLQELTLPEISLFWKKNNYRFSSLEKMLVLSVTGGVPKYLEEILPSESAEQNIINLSLKQNGILYNEFDLIFRQVFARRSNSYEKIIKACLEQKLSPKELGDKIGKSLNSELSNDIHHLELSGFLARDYYFNPEGKISKLSHLRVKDNYLRYFYKIILENRAKIEKGGVKIKSLYQIPSFEAILGYQFENLVLANKSLLNKFLGIDDSQIISCAPYVQRKNSKNKVGCQIDLLIESNLNVFFLCELICKKIIDKEIIKEVERKMTGLNTPKKYGIKPVLVYHGQIYPGHLSDIHRYFYKLISFDELLMS